MDFYETSPGPVDESVLYDQDKHVSAAVWEGQERGALRCHEHTSKLDRWMLTEKQIELVKKAGFGYLRLIPAISLDNPLISALVERWRRETNTFHMTVGEMTVTLEDVAYLLGLPIDGEPVIGVTYTACDALCIKYLGKLPDSGYASGGMVKLSWLKETFSQCPENASMEDVECHTRAYLLYLVGSTIFSTTTGNKVPVMYLPLFENFNEAGKHAWGAAALSFLYRALGNASLRSQSTISGCLTLLQCWSYYHLNIGRPKLHHDPIHECFPFVLRWKGKHSSPTSNRDVSFYRKALDSLQSSDVDWCPYANISHTVIPEFILNQLILGRSKTMLICFDKAERHLPDRCLRQFGMHQTIPEEVQRWERKTRGVDGGVDLSGKMESELNEWSYRRFHIVEAEEDLDENEYKHWYLKITRKLVGRPVPISSEFQRMNAALRDVAHLADNLSTHGMDDLQIQSVTRIRYIAHECLRDHARSSTDVIADPQNDVGKRIRGKERVRRREIGKRKRKDDPEQYYAVNMNVPSQLYDDDNTHLYHVDGDVNNHQHLSIPANAGDHSELSPIAREVNGGQLCDVTDDVDCDITDRVDECKLSHGSDQNMPPGSHPTVDVMPQSTLSSSEEVARQNDFSVLA
ncbi:protein MAIN-LIKE 2-like isoform X1 [Olea europaea var. sylvestris]|uniref:protein MAIN-LIKE 2-like isoform X1 n=1 Tax=Olea europaea var. sylvestris TaxID=158386 RepID=UPI000C1D2FEE|nr:protein MAIN-LIKE 2-like isoform X1 [Olea europaea var. sylvestris]XP_022842152.1 protein MAIN-LIKE 2-like isoform X1 [Olea europaea var. sylvestris]XP_022842153.1 protein MAIN-LIKE 2-like isoform X1 [Olea europaea var. sylvestris]XP_022842154.1 protein MAIN-LIKE 2-like isoform X1 [Olea europaea var. sylvestris]XP_022842155.1 protein MAIN-LIKE 2-like isoform X1 [Olea europaea var. sylvestris]